MAQKKQSFPDRLAAGARGILRIFALLFLGFALAHLESVQRIEKSAGTGELGDALLSDVNDSYDQQITAHVNSPHALDGGAILIGPEFSRELALLLIDEQGRTLHRWKIENGFFNPLLKEWWKNLAPGKESAIDDARLLPGGDVIFAQLTMTVNNYRGQRLARMDRDSRILWQVPGNFHHFIDIAGKPQTIYALSSRLRDGFPGIGPAQKSIRYLDDYIEAYGLDGKKLNEWSIVDAFENSPYRAWLSSFEISTPVVQRIVQPDGRVLYDLLHMNSVQYLDAKKAKAIPSGQEGDLLVSFRDLNAIAVLRPATRKIIWASKGPWRHQHNAQAGEDGKIYMFDNEGRSTVTLYTQGGPPERYISRIARFDAYTNQFDEIYASPALYSYFLGDYYHLSNGEWVISSPLQGRVLALSSQWQVLWELRTQSSRGDYVPHRKQLSFMHYYPADALKFLDAAAPASQ